MADVRSKRAPTMNDVARLAGVSQTTVSFVLNKTPNVSIPEETRERVWAAVEKLGYRPNALAQGLRMQRSNIIGFITDEIAITPHAGKTIEGAQDVAWENDQILVLVNTKSNRQIEETAVEMLLERQVEGILYATMYHRPVQVPDALREVPTVLLDCFVEDGSFPSVVPDEFNGGRTATEHLLKKGHWRIGYINNVDPIPAAFGRLEGYKAALAAYEVPYDERLVCVEQSDSGGGYRGVLQLMQQPDPPSALFCFNDRMAMGAYDALRKLNLRIPEDVAVMGFDNQELIAAYLFPPLTTVELPHYQMGAWAVNYLLKMIENSEEVAPVQQKIECRLVERASA
jgi:LacI family transcriptional regulator, galactose operon repressor